jgi:acyl-[acyl-carrier-protein] desaturase
MKKFNQIDRKKSLEILKNLEPDVESILNKHISSRKDWYPHEIIPWNRYSEIEKNGFEYNKDKISENLISTIYLLIMTEDNLPWYARTITGFIGDENRNTVWNEWLQQWVAEEDNHSYVIRNYITLNGLMNPYFLEDARMNQVKKGLVPDDPNGNAVQWLTYTTLQELAGRSIYLRVADQLREDSEGYNIIRKVTSDENRHFIFYRDVCKKGFEKYPSEFIISLASQAIDFQLPANYTGSGVLDFDIHSRLMANGGFYNLEIYIEEVIKPMISFWKLDEIKNISAEAEDALAQLMNYIEKSDRLIEKIKDRTKRVGYSSKNSEFNKVTQLSLVAPVRD